MNQMIEQILEKNKPEIEKRKKRNAIRDTQYEKNNSFVQAIEKGFQADGIAVIGEIKLASPTAVHLGDEQSILERVSDYEAARVSAISVITEPFFFHGSLDFVKKVKHQVSLPVLQKDFVVDGYQIKEARQIGSDAILLIVKLVDLETLKRFVDLAIEIGIEPIVEINDEADLEMALQTKTKVIAVNARDLNTFQVDVKKAAQLLKQIPDTFIKLGFSGIKTSTEVKLYKTAGAKGVLVGTELMKASDRIAFLKELKNVS